jgi:hypothetical protein
LKSQAGLPFPQYLSTRRPRNIIEDFILRERGGNTGRTHLNGRALEWSFVQPAPNHPHGALQ